MQLKDLLKEPKQRTILDLDILKKKFKIDKKYLLIPLFLIIFFLIDKRYFVYGFLTVFSGIFSFYHDKINRTPIDFKMPLFFGIIITRYYGLHFTLVFFILSDVIPSLLGGGRIQGPTLFFYAWYFIINAAVLLFPQTNIIVIGIILVIVEFFGSIIIKSFFGIPGAVAIVSSVLSVLTRVVYFLTLGEVFQFLFKLI